MACQRKHPGSAVFLAGGNTYKVKRVVYYPYMEFSSLEKRRSACETEIAVNRENAPNKPIYPIAEPAMTISDDDELKAKRICVESVGEANSRTLIVKENTEGDCDYCEKRGFTTSIGDMAERIEPIHLTIMLMFDCAGPRWEPRAQVRRAPAGFGRSWPC